MREKIKEIVLLYLSNKVTRQELCEWAVSALHKILIDIIRLDYLKMLPIVEELSEMEDMNDAECESLARRIYSILSGRENASYTFAMKIPDEFITDNLFEFGNILEKYLKQRNLVHDELEIIRKESKKRIDYVNTIGDLLELQIIGLLNLGYNLENEDVGMNFELKSTVCISEDMEDNLEEDVLDKVISLVECYNGKKSVYVQVWFHIDTEDISNM